MIRLLLSKLIINKYVRSTYYNSTSAQVLAFKSIRFYVSSLKIALHFLFISKNLEKCSLQIQQCKIYKIY